MNERDKILDDALRAISVRTIDTAIRLCSLSLTVEDCIDALHKFKEGISSGEFEVFGTQARDADRN